MGYANLKFDVIVGTTDLILLAGALAAYLLPLRRRPHWQRWALLFLAVNAVCLSVFRTAPPEWYLAAQLLLFPLVVAEVNRCAELSLPGSCYCAVWVDLSIQIVYEAWLILRRELPGVVRSTLTDSLLKLGIAAVFFAVVHLTLGRWMPEGDLYQIGPRQLSSALLIFVLFTTMNCFFVVLETISDTVVAIILLCQVFCGMLLFLQTEMFKRSRMQHELDAMNLLYRREEQRFAIARQNISLVDQKCAELQRQIEALQQHLPEEEQAQARAATQLESARHACDAVFKTGNDALDIALAESKLLADEKQIQLTCVADGKLLEFMEVVDIYALFANVLNNGIEAVGKFPELSHRLIDLVVHESQNFLVINVSNPLPGSLEFSGGLPLPSKQCRGALRGYGLRVVRQVVERYHGMLSIRAENGFFTLKILIPLPKQ